MSINNFDGIIFDLDGTLWDARESICMTWNEILRKHYPELGQLTVESFNAQMGKLLPDIGRSFFPHVSDEVIDDILERCLHRENEYIAEHGGVLFDGLEETLQKLSENAKLYIVSNCQSGYIEAFFTAHGLQRYFTDWQDSSIEGSVKSDNIRTVVERNGIQRPVYVGDTALDGQSARDAGTAFIFARYGFGSTEQFDAAVDDIRELPQICSALAANIFN